MSVPENMPSGWLCLPWQERRAEGGVETGYIVNVRPPTCGHGRAVACERTWRKRSRNLENIPAILEVDRKP